MDVVILHGWGRSGSDYTHLAKVLNKHHFTVYHPDLPGFGKEKIHPKKTYDLNDYVDFVESFTKKKKLHRFLLIGHSFGGRVAIKYAYLYPEHLFGLVLTGAPAIREKKVKVYSFLTLAKIGKLFFAIPPLCFIKSFAQRFLYFLAGEKDYYQASPMLKKAMEKVIAEHLTIFLPQIKIPTLLLWGEKDRIVPLKVAQDIAKKIKNSRLVVILGDHKIPYENPKRFAEEVNKFVNLIKSA